MIDLAKAKGRWQPVPDDAGTVVPDDLRERLDGNEAARANFAAFPPSSKRLILGVDRGGEEVGDPRAPHRPDGEAGGEHPREPPAVIAC